MDKRILWSVVIVLSVAVVWLASRQNLPAAAEQTQTASPTVSPPRSPDGASAAADSTSAALTPAGADSTLATPVSVSTRPAADPVLMSATGAALPIDVSPGFEYVNTPVPETNGLWPILRRHQLLQSEARDDTWAPMMEVALRHGIQDALTEKGYDTQRIELPVVECRSNGCEIQAVGYTDDLGGKHDVDLQRIVPALLKGNLGNELENFSALHRTRADGRMTVLVHLSRKRP